MRKVRALRKDAAMVRVAKKKRAVEHAQRQVMEKKKELISYKETYRKKEQQLLIGLAGREVSGHNLHFFIEKSQWMRTAENRYVERVVDAEKKKEEAIEKEHQATAYFQQMAKNEMKLDEHYKIWEEENKHNEADDSEDND
jgi:hypothetical protein